MASRVYLLSFLLLTAQGLLAWHLPEHLNPEPHQPLELVSTVDCDICAPGTGATPPAPALEAIPSAEHRHPAPPRTEQAPRQAFVPGAGARAPPALS